AEQRHSAAYRTAGQLRPSERDLRQRDCRQLWCDIRPRVLQGFHEQQSASALGEHEQRRYLGQPQSAVHQEPDDNAGEPVLMVNLAPISTQRPLIVTVLGLIAMLGACVYYEPSAIAVDIEPIPDQVATAGDIVELPVVIIGATDNVVSISAVSSDLDLVSDLEVRRMGSSHELMLVAVTH